MPCASASAIYASISANNLSARLTHIFISWRLRQKWQPVASNDTPKAASGNRRVELVVNGDAIGGTASASAASSQR